MSIETIARRYGSALADSVLSTGQADTVRTELAGWNQTIAASSELQAVFTNPSIPLASKERVLDELLKRSSPSRTTANFLRVLLRNGRLGELPEVNERFNAILEERSGTVSAQVISARDLPVIEREEFKANLEKLTGKRVNIAFMVDESIIGGAVTRIGSTVYDGSVKTKLENLKAELIGA
jgi:F-type H+-transporting ATPase subunit delta